MTWSRIARLLFSICLCGGGKGKDKINGKAAWQCENKYDLGVISPCIRTNLQNVRSELQSAVWRISLMENPFSEAAVPEEALTEWELKTTIINVFGSYILPGTTGIWFEFLC